MNCTVCETVGSHHHHRINGIRQEPACTCGSATYSAVTGWTASEG